MHRLLLVTALLVSNGPATAQGSRGPQSPSSSPRLAALEVLRAGVQSNNPEHRMKAVAAAGSIGPVKEAVDFVTAALQDKDPMVRRTAASMLGEMKAPAAIPELRTAMDDRAAEVRFAAAKALWDLGDTSGRSLIQQVLMGERSDAPPLVQGAIQEAKRKLHEPSQLAVLGIEQALGALPGPFGMGADAAQELLKDKGASGRTIAADILAKDSDPSSLLFLEWALTDKSWIVRAAAAKALGTRGNAQTIAKLQPLLADAHHMPRFMAAASILKLASR